MDPQAVRRARLEAGLSLAEVAQGELTRAAIHLVETGKSRPSARTLELIARRTGKPTSYFLRAHSEVRGTAPESIKPQDQLPRAGVEELARVAMAGNGQQAIDAALRLLPTVCEARSQAHVRYYLGRAYVQLSQPDAALEHLQRARVLFGQMEDPWMTVECMDWEAGALYLLERSEALRLATDALARCRDLSPVPVLTEVRILGHIAAIHTLRHEWNEAISRYEEAIEKAGAVRDLSRLGKMYNDLSLAYQRTGALNAAAAYLHKALAVHEMQQNRQEQAFSENNLALVLMEQGQLAAAERHLQASLTLFDELKLVTRRSHALLSLSELKMTRGSFPEAQRLAAEALALATNNHEPMTAAMSHQLLAQLAEQCGDPSNADQEFSKAIAILEGLDVPKRLVECHAKYAQILEARGDSTLALQHLKAAVAVVIPEVARSYQRRIERLA